MAPLANTLLAVRLWAFCGLPPLVLPSPNAARTAGENTDREGIGFRFPVDPAPSPVWANCAARRRRPGRAEPAPG